jgi:hypothetical protein
VGEAGRGDKSKDQANDAQFLRTPQPYQARLQAASSGSFVR